MRTAFIIERERQRLLARHYHKDATMTINSISDFRKAMRNGPYAWPGGYPLYFIMADGEALSFRAAKDNRRAILQALRDRNCTDWLPIGIDVNWEDKDLMCAHRGEPIECAYGD